MLREPRAAETPETSQLRAILDAGADWGHTDSGAGQRVLFEFVSAPPNVSLSITHGRGGVVGDTLAALFTAVGCEVQREFYVNDASDTRPLRSFARATLERYKALCGIREPADNPPPGSEYPEAFAAGLAESLFAERGRDLAELPPAEALQAVWQFAMEQIGADQRAVLDLLEIRFDNWFSDRNLRESGAVAEIVETLLSAGHAERRKDGSVWLMSSHLGDESDRALIRADSGTTYLAADLAYHRDKFARGYDRLVDIWGSDHAAYVARTRAGLTALGLNSDRLAVVLCNPVRLLRDGTELKGTGQGGGPMLRELIEQVGADTARFELLLRPANLPLDLDIDAAMRDDAPLSRVRTAISEARRFCGPPYTEVDFSIETDKAGRDLIDRLSDLPAIVKRGVDELAAQLVPQYSAALAESYLTWRGEDTKSNRAIAQAVGITLENALALAGISDALPPGAAQA